MKFRRSKKIFKVSIKKIIKNPIKKKLFITSIIQNHNNSTTFESINNEKSNKKPTPQLNSCKKSRRATRPSSTYSIVRAHKTCCPKILYKYLERLQINLAKCLFCHPGLNTVSVNI